MPLTITRILIEGISSATPNRPITLRDSATKAVLGSGMCDGTGRFSVPAPFALFLEAVAAGHAEASAVPVAGSQAAAAGGHAGATGSLSQAQALGGGAGGSAAGTGAALPGPLAGAAAGQGGASGTLSRPTALPAVLAAPDREGGTAAASGDDLVFEDAEWVEYRLDAGEGGLFGLTAAIDASVAGRAEVLVDGEEATALVYGGDFDVVALEEEGFEMPMHSATEAEFSAPSGATATQADSVTAGRGAPTSRYRVTIINTHPSDRLAVGLSQAAAQASNPKVVEPDFGECELFADANVPIWVRPLGTNAITVRIIQGAAA